MQKVFLTAVAALWVALAASAQEAMPPNDRIEDTIQSQIDAFLRDDFETAFRFAAPGIRRMFRTPGNFGAMVKNGYPMVWRPEDVEFGALHDRADGLWQRVVVRDSDGRRHVLEYRMQRVDNDWRIAGVRILPAPDLSA
jgi:hypothetical protein